MTAEPFVASGVNVRINPEALVDDIAAALDAFRVDLMNNGAKVWMSCPLRMLPVAGWVVPLTVLLPIQQKKERLQNKGMTIDERLEKLTERHEALAATVELMAIEHREFMEKFNIYMRRMDRFSGILADGFEKLVNIAEDHEKRVNKLEGGR